jgi:hypothetical protein
VHVRLVPVAAHEFDVDLAAVDRAIDAGGVGAEERWRRDGWRWRWCERLVDACKLGWPPRRVLSARETPRRRARVGGAWAPLAEQ